MLHVILIIHGIRVVWKCNNYYFLKCFFVRKYIKIIFLKNLKFNFDISTLKRFKNIKNYFKIKKVKIFRNTIELNY